MRLRSAAAVASVLVLAGTALLLLRASTDDEPVAVDVVRQLPAADEDHLLPVLAEPPREPEWAGPHSRPSPASAPSLVGEGGAFPPDRLMDREFALRYEGLKLPELRAAVKDVGRRRRELAMPLIEAKFASGDSVEDPPVGDGEIHDLDLSSMKQDLQAVVCGRISEIPGTGLKQPRTVVVQANEDPDLLVASMELRWLLERMKALRLEERR